MLLLKKKWPLVTNYSVNHDMVPSGERSSLFSKVTWAISNHLRWQIYILKPGLEHSTRIQILTGISKYQVEHKFLYPHHRWARVFGWDGGGHLNKDLSNSQKNSRIVSSLSKYMYLCKSFKHELKQIRWWRGRRKSIVVKVTVLFMGKLFFCCS